MIRLQLEAAGCRPRCEMILVALAFSLVGCGTDLDVPREFREPLMSRWNQLAAGVRWKTPDTSCDRTGTQPSCYSGCCDCEAGWCDSGFDMGWFLFEGFPHPTFRGGSEGAYQAFSDVLAAFLEKHFDFLSWNGLLRATLRYDYLTLSGDHETSFEAITQDMLRSNNWVGLSAETLRSLQNLEARIRLER